MLRTLASAFLFAVLIILIPPTEARAQLSGSVTKGARVVGMTVVPIGERVPDALLLSRRAVQEELKVTEEQKKKLERLEKARLQRSRQFNEAARAVNQNEFSPLPEADFEDFREQENELNAEVSTTIGQILSARQRQRLAQIALQVEGAMAFSRDDVLQKLNVDDEQVEEIRDILQASREQMNRNAALPPGDDLGVISQPQAAPGDVEPLDPERARSSRKVNPALNKANGRVNDEALRKIARVLRRKQWEIYTRLKGQPFDLERLNGVTTKPRDGKPTAAAASQPNSVQASAEPKTASRKTLRQRRGSSSDTR